MDTSVQVRSSSRASRCGLCHAEVAPEEARACAGCGATSHAGCLLELGGRRCPTIGCIRNDSVRPDVELPPPLRCCQGDLPPVGAPGVVVCAGCGGRWHPTCHARAGCCPGEAAFAEAVPGPPFRLPVPGSLRSCNRCRAPFEVQAAALWSWRCPTCARRDTLVAVGVIVALTAAPLVVGLCALLAGWVAGQ